MEKYKNNLRVEKNAKTGHLIKAFKFRKIKKSTINKLYKDSSSLNMGYGEYLFDLFSDSSEEINNYVK